jgi:hypothetical protein
MVFTGPGFIAKPAMKISKMKTSSRSASAKIVSFLSTKSTTSQNKKLVFLCLEANY